MAKFLRRALGLLAELPTESKQKGLPADGATTPLDFQIQPDDLQKFEAHFDQVLSDANMPGADYYEFIAMMEALEAAVPDEPTRIQAVYAALSVQGLNRDRLIESAAAYKEILNQDKVNFTYALGSKSTSDVDAKKQRSLDLAQRIADHKILIEKLNKEMEEAQQEIEKMKQDIADAEVKLQSRKQGYTAAHSAVLYKIDRDITTIKNTIQ